MGDDDTDKTDEIRARIEDATENADAATDSSTPLRTLDGDEDQKADGEDAA
jgi:hypothetical protein